MKRNGCAWLAASLCACTSPAVPADSASTVDARSPDSFVDSFADDRPTADGSSDAARPDTSPADSAPNDASSPDAFAADGATPTSIVGPRVTRFTSVGALTLTTGMTVTGVHVTTTTGPCIRGANVTDVHIVDSRIGPCGPDARGVGIDLYNASRIHVDHNAFDDVASGLYVDGHPGPATDIVFDHNRVGRVRGPLPRGQMVQLNHVRGAGHAILCNIDDETSPGYLVGPEDHVSVFESAGTSASPIRIAFNRIRGGGPSTSGGGILAGDGGTSFIDVTDNVLVQPGQYGIAISGGDHARLLRNIVYSPMAFAWSNVGVYVWNQVTGGLCEANEVRGNRVFYVGRMGPNHSWNAGNCGVVAGWSTDNTFGDTTLSAAVWDTHFAACD